MSTTTAAPLLDPLAEGADQGAIAVTATAPPTERVAPDVTALPGADAVAILRAAGLIAAIESVASELPPGTVIDQDPAPGAPLGREAVVTLRLAAAPAVEEIAVPVEDPDSTVELQALDDTERWFAALAVSDNDGIPPRRRRKHRQPSVSPGEPSIVPPPPPLAPPESEVRARRMGPAGQSAFAALLTAAGAFAVALACSASQWRRPAALAACALLLVILGLRLFTANGRRPHALPPQSAAHSGAFTVSPRAAAAKPPTPGERVRFDARPLLIHPRAVRRSRRAPRPVARATAVAPAPPATARSLPVVVQSVPAPAASQFAYLGQ